jgi:deoxyribodipyrimidine photo-lyase
MIHEERIQALNDAEFRDGRYVLYWMQASQRACWNHALEYAIERANERGQRLVACFGLTAEYPEANKRHYAFMLQGLAETQTALSDRGIKLVLRKGSPVNVAAELAEEASLVVCDAGYLRHHVQWRCELARRLECPLIQVETDIVVPVETASGKAEYAARTLRPKLHRHWDRFLVPLQSRKLKKDSLGLRIGSEDAAKRHALLEVMHVDGAVRATGYFRGGSGIADERLQRFIDEKLTRYADARNDPSLDIQSHMSPYLHFGQISPVQIALRIRDSDAPARAIDAYLEELIVRRELAINHVWYTDDYDRYAALPDWAKKTLAEHQNDVREHVYTQHQLETGQTHDRWWNAAMREMRITGKMHNYMRMYWGKKILEWTNVPQTAFAWILEMNNRYFLDGRDPSSFANVAWCFGLHDRAWKEREVFGKVRYMNAAGLERKFNIEAYAEWAEGLDED